MDWSRLWVPSRRLLLESVPIVTVSQELLYCTFSLALSQWMCLWMSPFKVRFLSWKLCFPSLLLLKILLTIFTKIFSMVYIMPMCRCNPSCLGVFWPITQLPYQVKLARLAMKHFFHYVFVLGIRQVFFCYALSFNCSIFVLFGLPCDIFRAKVPKEVIQSIVNLCYASNVWQNEVSDCE